MGWSGANVVLPWLQTQRHLCIIEKQDRGDQVVSDVLLCVRLLLSVWHTRWQQSHDQAHSESHWSYYFVSYMINWIRDAPNTSFHVIKDWILLQVWQSLKHIVWNRISPAFRALYIAIWKARPWRCCLRSLPKPGTQMLLSRSAETWEHPGCVTKLLWPLSPPLGQHCLNRDYHTTVHIKGTPPCPTDPNHYKYSRVTTLTVLALLFGIA